MEKKSIAILQKYIIAFEFFSFCSICVVVISFHDIIIISRKILFRLTFTEDGVNSRREFLKIESVQLETVQNNCCRQN